MRGTSLSVAPALLRTAALKCKSRHCIWQCLATTHYAGLCTAVQSPCAPQHVLCLHTHTHAHARAPAFLPPVSYVTAHTSCYDVHLCCIWPCHPTTLPPYHCTSVSWMCHLTPRTPCILRPRQLLASNPNAAAMRWTKDDCTCLQAPRVLP